MLTRVKAIGETFLFPTKEDSVIYRTEAALNCHLDTADKQQDPLHGLSYLERLARYELDKKALTCAGLAPDEYEKASKLCADKWRV